MEVRYGGDMEVVLTSKIWAQYPLYGYLWIRLDKCSSDPATSRLNWTSGRSWRAGKSPPSRASWAAVAWTPISTFLSNTVQVQVNGVSVKPSDQGETEFDHLRTLPIYKCTMCDFPNFLTRSNNSRFSSISGVFSAMVAPRKVVDTVLESSTRED